MLSYQEVLTELLMVINQEACDLIGMFHLAFLS
jgi:hypothetical protein